MGSSWNELGYDESPNENGGSGNKPMSEFTGLFPEYGNQNLEMSNFFVNPNVSFTKPNRITPGKIVGMVFVGLIVSALLFVLVCSLYTRFIRFPSEQKRVWEESRLYAVQGFCKDVNNIEVKVEGSYIMKELSYANGNKHREAFIKKMLSTVSYSTETVNKKNVFGNDLIDKKTGKILTESSWLEEDEKANVAFIDYAAISFNKDKVASLVDSSDLTASDIDYRNKLTDLFCQYICSMDSNSLPLVSSKRVPQLAWNQTGYTAILSEDIYLDKSLFSSNELYDCFERFAEVVADVVGVELQVSSEYREWESLKEVTGETSAMPPKYGKHSISRIWCGAYYLINDYTSNPNGVAPQLGNGSKSQPASVGTSVITYVIQTGENGEETKLPIRITMTEFGVSQKAINWFQAKHIQNRGYDVTSELQYCYFVFEVTNLSNEVLTVYDNTALCDANANCSSRTGTIYGLQSSVTLDPEETGIIESWGRSTELNLKYVIWGEDFARRENPVWFRVLAGDLEDPSWDKGVYINNTRG